MRAYNRYKVGTIEKLRCDLRIAMSYEKRGEIEQRNSLAQHLFKTKNYRKVTNENDITVETWWDAKSRNFITHTLDREQNEIGENSITGNKDDAAVAHLWALNRILN